MMLLVISVLIALLGISLLVVAYVVAHQSFLPKISRPEFLWVPGIGLLILACIVAMTPGILTYSQCEQECDVLEGGATTPHGEQVPKVYESCVNGSVSHKRQEMVRQLEADPDDDVDIPAVIEAAMPDIEAVCGKVAQDRCVQICYAGTQATEEEP